MPRRRVELHRKPAGEGEAFARLQPGEAEQVLRRLLRAHPELRPEAERLARGLLAETSPEDPAEEIVESIRALDIDDLNERAGVHRGEYTDPGDAAWALLEEVVTPHLDRMRRLLASGLLREARSALRGILCGLYAMRDGTDQGDVLGWAPDFPEQMAVQVADAWRAAGRALPPGALTDVPHWTRALGGH